MSLGPFPLLGANSNNIHGHFESMPFYTLNCKVQEIALGFPDDFPKSEEVLTRFLDGKGIWPEGVKIPDELFDEGRRLVAGLVGSGGISGFKDPRTVLTWPFWRQVLQEFPFASGRRRPLAPLAARDRHESVHSQRWCTGLLGLSGSDRGSFRPDEGHPGERESGHESHPVRQRELPRRPCRSCAVLWADLERSRRPASVRSSVCSS